jgi:VanZ family protein
VPNVVIPLAEAQFDKVLHILGYAPFGFLVARGLGGTRPSISSKNLWMLTALAAFLYGISDEYHQSFVTGRGSGVFDIIGDTIGGVLGGYIYLLRRRKIK